MGHDVTYFRKIVRSTLSQRINILHFFHTLLGASHQLQLPLPIYTAHRSNLYQTHVIIDSGYSDLAIELYMERLTRKAVAISGSIPVRIGIHQTTEL